MLATTCSISAQMMGPIVSLFAFKRDLASTKESKKVSSKIAKHIIALKLASTKESKKVRSKIAKHLLALPSGRVRIVFAILLLTFFVQERYLFIISVAVFHMKV